MKNNELRTFQLYNTMKLGFLNGYDFRKYGLYNKRFTQQKLDSSYFRYECSKFAVAYPDSKEQENIMAANFVRDPNISLANMSSDASITLRRYNSSLQDYVDDSKRIFSEYSLRELLNKNDPAIISLLSIGKIEPEWFVMTNKLLPLSKILDEQDNFIWKTYSRRLTMYNQFVIIDSVESIKILRNYIVSIANKAHINQEI